MSARGTLTIIHFVFAITDSECLFYRMIPISPKYYPLSKFATTSAEVSAAIISTTPVLIKYICDA
jgi:hypothetical protein